ncbi:MAG: hypothetical protein ABSG50_04255 [Opitutaceae bacterium]
MPASPSSAPPVRIVDALRVIGPGLILTAGGLHQLSTEIRQGLG